MFDKHIISDDLATQPGLAIGREINTILVGIILSIAGYVGLGWLAPHLTSIDLHDLVRKFVGVSWPFFAAVTVFLIYVISAWLIEIFEINTDRDWSTICQSLHWAAEACPLVGLLTTFLSLLTALLAYGEAGPTNPGTQAIFITQFAIAFGSSIAGGILALIAFTLHRIVPSA
jgi:hypothetical protein